MNLGGRDIYCVEEGCRQRLLPFCSGWPADQVRTYMVHNTVRRYYVRVQGKYPVPEEEDE